MPPGSYGPVNTVLTGINNAGIIVGAASDRRAGRGFWLSQNVFHFFEKFAGRGNSALGINDRGDVVGSSGSNFLAFAFPPQGLLNVEFLRAQVFVQDLNDARILIGDNGQFNSAAFVATPLLTLQVASPENRTTVNNPVHVSATARGQNPVSSFEVWVNRQQIYSVNGASLNADINVPVGANERFVIKAIDSTGVIAKVVDQINVN
jgi:hypothetical protein